MKRRFLFAKYALLTLFALFITVPFIWVFYSSFRPESALFAGTYFTNPADLTLDHYKSVLTSGSGQFPDYFRNSLLIAIISSLIVVTLAVLGAYSLSRFRMRFKNHIILTLLLTNMFPPVLIAIPMFALLLKLNLLNTYTGIIATHIILGLPFGLWLIKGYFDSVPTELDEAAMIDGLSPFGVLFRVILPITSPGMVVAAFYAFMVSWGDFLYASLISQSLDTHTLPLGLNKFFGSTQIQWGAITAATVITIVPTVALFALLQKWIVEGLASGAVKG